MGLELYAQVEDRLGLKESTPQLHSYYFSLFKDELPKKLLDVGCGDGQFIQHCLAMGIEAQGVDLSEEQVKKAKAKGLDVTCTDVASLSGSFDAITVIFDVVNFIEPSKLTTFFRHLDRLLTPKGKLYLDINTLFGFEAVAQGVMVDKSAKDTLIVEAIYEDEKLTTTFDLFVKQGTSYTLKQDTITQYFYTIASLLSVTKLTLLLEMPLCLYDEEADKQLLVFQKA